MPNWCINNVTILGSKENVETVVDFLRSDETHFSLEKIKPTPPDGDNADVMPDWYNWRVENWGTKWDVDAKAPEVGVMEDFAGGTITYASYSFDSAWAPPENVIDFLAKMFPEVCIHLAYDEPGMDFAGVTFWQNGDVYERHDFGHSLIGMQASFNFQEFLEYRDIEV